MRSSLKHLINSVQNVSLSTASSWLWKGWMSSASGKASVEFSRRSNICVHILLRYFLEKKKKKKRRGYTNMDTPVNSLILKPWANRGRDRKKTVLVHYKNYIMMSQWFQGWCWNTTCNTEFNNYKCNKLEYSLHTHNVRVHSDPCLISTTVSCTYLGRLFFGLYNPVSGLLTISM